MLTHKQLEEIRQLQKVCEAFDDIQLKLNWDMLQTRTEQDSRDLFYYENGYLIGFLGLYGFGSKVELCGMVHPDYRRRGIFAKLFAEALQICEDHKFSCILLNAPANSQSAKDFLRNVNCSLTSKELQMKWEETVLQDEAGVSLRHSTPADMNVEILIDIKSFGNTEEDAIAHNKRINSEDNQINYIIESAGKAVGKMRVSHQDREAWIYGFAVLPEYQGKGIGRKALKKVIIQEHKNGFPLFLEVEASNLHALTLYESCGFKAFHAQDYYEYNRLK